MMKNVMLTGIQIDSIINGLILLEKEQSLPKRNIPSNLRKMFETCRSVNLIFEELIIKWKL